MGQQKSFQIPRYSNTNNIYFMYLKIVFTSKQIKAKDFVKDLTDEVVGALNEITIPLFATSTFCTLL